MWSLSEVLSLVLSAVGLEDKFKRKHKPEFTLKCDIAAQPSQSASSSSENKNGDPKVPKLTLNEIVLLLTSENSHRRQEFNNCAVICGLVRSLSPTRLLPTLSDVSDLDGDIDVLAWVGWVS
jgi:hypothetical protein